MRGRLLGNRDRRVRLGLKVRKDPRDPLGRWGLRDLRATREPWAIPGRKGPRVCQGRKAPRGTKAIPERKDNKGRLEPMAQLVPKVRRGRKGFREPRAILVLKGPQDRKVRQAPRAQKEYRDRLVRRGKALIPPILGSAAATPNC
jgi:hypothetical protein